MHESAKLLICGLEYRVVYASSDEVPELADNEGWCDVRTNTLFIRRGMPRSRMQDTLVHELLHAFFESSGLDHFMRGPFADDESAYEKFEETLIRLTVPAIRRLIEDNGRALIDVPQGVSAEGGAKAKSPSRAKRGRK